jgi:DNA mismatch repair protein MutS2
MHLKYDSRDSLEFNKVCNIIIREAVSGAGKEEIFRLKPLTDFDQIITKQKKISALRSSIDSGTNFPLENFPDIRKDLTRCKVAGTYFTTEILFYIRRILEQSDAIRQHYKKHQVILKPLEHLILRLNSLHPILRLIKKTVDENRKIRDNASPNLACIRKSIASETNRLHKEIEKLMEKAKQEGWLHEENPTIREGRLVLPLKSEDKRKIKGIIHGQSATGATVFLEPLEIVEINNTLKDLEQEEKEEIEKILKNITSEIRQYFPDLEQDIAVLIELDSLNACAKFSRKFNCTEPELSLDTKIINLINARHPLLSTIKEVVPLNVTIEDKIRSVIITGPNAGGKTVAMKTIGLLCAMAMAGLHIPADEGSKIPFIDNFLIDIGDYQSIENDLSTFSSHISNMKLFIEKATNRSIILIDELGTGTDPIEGAALGQTILEEFIKKGAISIVTTHHSALKAFAGRNPFVINAAMEFDTQSLSPTYRLILGIPGASYALEISKRFGIPDYIISRARKMIGADTIKLEKLLLEVEELRRNLESKNREIGQHKKTLDKLISEYESKLAAVQEKYSEMNQKIADELERIISKSRSQIESTIKEIREKNANKESITYAKSITDEIKQNALRRKKITRKFDKEKSEQKKPAVGDAIKIDGIINPGIVIDISDSSKKVAVEIEGKKLWVPRNSVKIVSDNSQQGLNHKRTQINVDADKVSSQKLDLRGLRVDEAESMLIKYLDRAILSGLQEVEIIHGMGTGALQKMVWEVLKDFPGVKRYYFENFDRGGTGATIVEF